MGRKRHLKRPESVIPQSPTSRKATMILIRSHICLLKEKTNGMYPVKISKSEVEKRLLRGETIRGLSDVQEAGVEEWLAWKRLPPSLKAKRTRSGLPKVELWRKYV